MEYLAVVGGSLKKAKKFQQKLSISNFWNVFHTVELPEEDYFICYYHRVAHKNSPEWESSWMQISLLAEDLDLSWKTIAMGEDEDQILVVSYEGEKGTDQQLHKYIYVKRTSGCYGIK